MMDMIATTAAESTRPIEALRLPHIEPGAIRSQAPTFFDADPSQLRVDARYQRSLSEKSIALIAKIVAGWDWNSYKPPVVVRRADGDGWDVIDGQHTAIAALTHPSIAVIPVMLVEAEQIEDRAGAFLRHNRDRIAVSPLDLHHAAATAGDELALTINQVCARAGIRILRFPPSMGRYKPGDLAAVSGVRSLVNRRHALGARRVLEICVQGRLAPVSATAMKAVECLLFDREYKDSITAEDIASILIGSSDLERDVGRFAVEHKLPLWRAMASVIFMKKGRRRAG